MLSYILHSAIIPLCTILHWIWWKGHFIACFLQSGVDYFSICSTSQLLSRSVSILYQCCQPSDCCSMQALAAVE